MPYVDIEGHNYYYSQNYQGNPKLNNQTIIFIHGAGGNHKFWYNQSKELSSEFLINVPDLPGHGKSEGTPINNIAGYSSFINKFIDSTAKAPVYLAGHSMGGAIAMDFALKYPQKLKKLILIGTGPRLRVMPQILETFSKGQHFLELVNWFYRKNPPQTLLDLAKKDVISTNPKVWFADFTACNNFDITDNLKNIKTNTLVIGAAEDMLTPLKYSKTLERELPRAKLEVIDGAGHMMMLEKPDQVNFAITNFIRGE
ncbi:alpha/beta fold hydrolase [Desulfolucanica intricata]|uniref:alpha/beta fold hydrolase n=1 Tax=Desulfolucanica intricata TaxID=1285191 RepID=UPI00082F1FE4|nr:alpha/beta hydrolase [Desulfolucanica intricata]